MAVWAVVFAGMSAAGGVGDRHPGQWLPFWEHACAENRPHACSYLAAKQSGHCNTGSGWACNEAGVLLAAVAGTGAVGDDREGVAQVEALFAFQRGCELGFEAACGNYRAILADNGAFERAPPTLDDYPIVLRGSRPSGESRTGTLQCCTPGLVARGGLRPASLSGDDEALHGRVVAVSPTGAADRQNESRAPIDVPRRTVGRLAGASPVMVAAFK